MKEKRKLRLLEGDIRTLRTYKNFRKEYPDFIYDRKKKIYLEPAELRIRVYKRKQKKPEVIAVIERKPKREIQRELIKGRIRKTVVLNLRSYEEPYAVSIKASTINPDINEDGLKAVVLETFRNSKYYGIEWYKKQIGYEPPSELGSGEDTRLNDGGIWITVQERMNPPVNFKYS